MQKRGHKLKQLAKAQQAKAQQAKAQQAKAQPNPVGDNNYPYYKYIKTPSQIGMSSKGDMKTLGKDMDGLINYVQILVSGKSKASTTGQALGNKYFLKTDATCIDNATKKNVDRYIYVNNVPSGNIPFISSGMGVNFSEFKGLIPGTLSNLNAFNPMALAQTVMAGSNPTCTNLTMETIDIYNKKSKESHFVTLVDVQNMDPCSFPKKTNPITKSRCKETFENMNNEMYYKIPDDILSQLYFTSLGALAIYILYCIMVKNGMLPKR